MTNPPASTPGSLYSIQHTAARGLFSNYKSVQPTLLLTRFQQLPIMFRVSPDSFPWSMRPCVISFSFSTMLFPLCLHAMLQPNSGAFLTVLRMGQAYSSCLEFPPSGSPPSLCSWFCSNTHFPQRGSPDHPHWNSNHLPLTYFPYCTYLKSCGLLICSVAYFLFSPLQCRFFKRRYLENVPSS